MRPLARSRSRPRSSERRGERVSSKGEGKGWPRPSTPPPRDMSGTVRSRLHPDFQGEGGKQLEGAVREGETQREANQRATQTERENIHGGPTSSHHRKRRPVLSTQRTVSLKWTRLPPRRPLLLLAAVLAEAPAYVRTDFFQAA